jgi:hypothetical protein
VTAATVSQARPSRPGALARRAWTVVDEHRLLSVMILAGLAARIVFWAVTDRKWEDGLITVIHARNAVEGIGLTHHAGEPVTHGFTSAVSVLVPLLGEAIHVGGGFLALRLTALIAFVFTAIAAYAIGKRLGLRPVAMFFALAYLAFDFNQIFYGMSGMETQIAVAVLLWGIYCTMTRRTVACGLLFGLAILTRPDFILFVGPALVSLFLWRKRESVRAALIGVGVVVPWVIFTTLYYGSPIPNTIKAKNLRYPLNAPDLLAGPGAWWNWLHDRILTAHDFWHAFTPFLEKGLINKGPLPEWVLGDIAFAFIVLAAVGIWFARSVPGWWPAPVFAIVFGLYDLITIPVGYYEWYLPPFMAVVALLAAGGMSQISKAGARKTGALLAVGLAIAFAVHIPYTFELERRVQVDIEDKVRQRLGEYLHRVVRPGEKVTSESAGYVGYYGRVLLYDYPGLTSKRALAIMERLGPDRNNIFELIKAAHPQWVVLRPSEYGAFQQLMPDVAGRYVIDRDFSVPLEKSSLSLGGVEEINIDRDFYVLRLKTIPPRAPAPPAPPPQ